MAQWLALGGFAAVGLGSMVGKRTKILLNHAAQLKKKKKGRRERHSEILYVIPVRCKLAVKE